MSRPRRTSTDFHAGVTLVVYGNGPQLVSGAAPLLDRLVAAGANSLSIAFPFFQRSSTATTIEVSAEQTPQGEHLSGLIRLARERGFSVMLRPLLDERTLIAEGQWRGSIRPSNIRSWFESYGGLLSHYAALAERERVEVLCIGTELVSLEQQRVEWQALIARLRAVYAGQLTYCANWDSFTRVPFWDKLDFVGVDGFFPLNAPAEATVEQLVAAWQPWTRQLNELVAAVGKPLVLTEQGVTSQRGSHRQPWLWDQKTPIDLEGQARYYRATCTALKSLAAGMYWWSVDLTLPSDPAGDSGYSPMGKPAEAEIRRCFA